MVAITVLLAAVVGVFTLGFDDELEEVSGNVKVDFDESPVGLAMTVEAISTTGEVQVNGETIATIDQGDTGRTILVPTAPGDRVRIVSGNDDTAILVDRAVEDRDEVGDFISYYRFDDQSNPNEIKDYSNQGNTLDLVDPGATYTTDGAVDFTHQTGGAKNTSLSGPLGVDVDAITVLMAVQVDGPGGGGGDDHSESMKLRVDSSTPGGDQIDFDHEEDGHDDYKTDFVSNEANVLASGTEHEFGSTHVYAVTISSEHIRAYIDGNNVGQASHDEEVRPEKFFIGNEFDGSEELDGKVYETRIYHHALNDEEIASVTSLMDVEP
jgi:hypothetical protein